MPVITGTILPIFVSAVGFREEPIFIDMEKKDFITKGAIWIAVVTAVIMAIIGLCFGKVIEENLFAEVTKWIFVTVVIIIGVLEGFWFSSVGLVIWHWKEKHKNEKADKLD